MAGFAQASKVPPEADSGSPQGKLYHIACKTWFTAGGAAMPLSFKFEDDSGELRTVRDLTVKYTEEKNYSGIPSREFVCESIIGGFLREFRLIFYCESCLWVMLI